MAGPPINGDLVLAGLIQATGLIQSDSGSGNSASINGAGSTPSVRVEDAAFFGTMSIDATGLRFTSSGNTHFIGSAFTFSNPAAFRGGLGLGSAATANISTSGAALGLLNSASIYSAVQTTNVNGGWAWSVSGVVGYSGATSAPAAGSAFGTSSNHPLYLFTNGAVRLTIDASGAAAFTGAVTAPNLPVAGTWTPTLTGVANVAASGAAPWYYQRVGNYVTFAGQIAVDPTTASVATRIGISLPIASAMTAQTDAAGTGVALGVAGVCGSVYADAANDRLTLEFLTADVANRQWHVTGMYRVI